MDNQIRYDSPRIQEKLKESLQYPITIVQAPSGYGKTTAVRAFLENQSELPVIWWNAAENAELSSWRGLCGKIAEFDTATGERLLELGFPDPANSWDIAELFRGLTSKQKCVLVLDDFQWMQTSLPHAVLSGLFSYRGKELHIVVITQTAYSLPLSLSKSHIFSITAEDLRLDVEDILQYCRLCGINADRGQAAQMYQYTEGWIVAVFLTVRQLRKEGLLTLNLSVVQMMERIVWTGLRDEEKAILLRLAHFSEITVPQLGFLLGLPTVPDAVISLLRQTPFIRYDESTDSYCLHAVLRELLLRRLAASPADLRRRCEVQAGKWYAREGDQQRGLECFWAAQDFESALSLPFLNMMFVKVNGRFFAEIAEDLVRETPEHVKRKYLIALLRIAYATLEGGRRESFSNLMREIASNIDNLEDEAYKKTMWGEWRLVFAFRYYPNILAMEPEIRKAAEQIGGKSRVFTKEELLLLGETDMMSFHLTPGRLEEEITAMDSICRCFQALTGERYYAAEVFRALERYYRGDLEGAEEICHKALYLLEDNGQWTLKMGLLHLLSRISRKRGEPDFLERLSQELSSMTGSDICKKMAADILWTDSFMSVGLLDQLPDWMQNEMLQELQYVSGGVEYLLIAVLYHKKEYSKMLGHAAAVLENRDVLPCHLEAYIRILRALVYLERNRRTEAVADVRKAVLLCAADGIFMPLLDFYIPLKSLILEVLDAEGLGWIRPLLKAGKAYGDNKDRLIRLLSGGGVSGCGLTRRELQVAELAARGKTNREIAAELMVSEATIRAHLRTVFSKLAIDRRGKIGEALQKI